MSKSLFLVTPLALLLLLGLPTAVSAQGSGDADEYKVRIDAAWYYAYPSGTVQARGDTLPIELQKDFSLKSYSAFSGKVDWKFTRKNHFYVEFIPLSLSGQTTLQRTIIFRGQTVNVGATAETGLTSITIAPGYQFDFVRRKWGHLGVGVQFNLINVSATLNAAAQVTGTGVHQAAVSASDSVLAPVPVAGPEFRLYLAPRVFIDGNLRGMYLFGYGDFVSTGDSLGVELSRHVALKAGYQMGSRLIVNDKLDRVGLRWTNQGLTAGLSVSF